MNKLLSSRGASAVKGIIAFALAAITAAAAPAQSVATDAVTAKPTSAPTVYLANGRAVSGLASTPAAAFVQTPFAMSRTLPLHMLVAMNSVGAPLDDESNCLAVAVYHEARGESLEGQLAVANVVINRARSGKYPPTWCRVVKQPWQFSFVNPRTGSYPAVNVNSHSWANAQAIARIAASNTAAEVDPDVLWYHADYVAPSWGRRLSFVEKIGTHIFYRA